MALPNRTSDQELGEVAAALSGIGLNEAEIRVYQASLSLGTRPASIIAEKAGLKRSHTYNILSTLQQKGIVQEVIKNSVRHFTCSPPHALIGIIDNQLGDLEQKKRSLESVIPILQGMLGGLARQPKVRFFQGKQGIREIFEDILRTPNVKEMCSFVDLQYSWSSFDEDMKHWVTSFIERREEKDIWWKAIAVNSDISNRELGRRSSRKREVKLVDGMRITAEINCYGPKVALTSTSEEMVGVVIENEPIVETIRGIHRYLWQLLPTYQEPELSAEEEAAE